MEIHEKACPKCGGDCKGKVQSGWFTCEKCGKKVPRHMLVKTEVKTNANQQ